MSVGGRRQAPARGASARKGEPGVDPELPNRVSTPAASMRHKPRSGGIAPAVVLRYPDRDDPAALARVVDILSRLLDEDPH